MTLSRQIEINLNLHDLNYYPEAVSGETRSSWLDCARKRSFLDPRLWRLWVGSPCSPDEPERGQFPDGSQWRGFPLAIGDIKQVPPFWRIRGELRNVRCESCEKELSRLDAKLELVDWCDARCLFCERHGTPLTYGSLGHRGWSELCSHGDVRVSQFRSWLDSLRRSRPADVRHRLCRDLVIMAMRNWSNVPSVGVGAEVGWWLGECGWAASTSCRLQGPYKPARLGHLCAIERIGSLYCAYQWHEQLRLCGSVHWRLLSPRAITWFERRWPSGAVSACSSTQAGA